MTLRCASARARPSTIYCINGMTVGAVSQKQANEGTLPPCTCCVVRSLDLPKARRGKKALTMLDHVSEVPPHASRRQQRAVSQAHAPEGRLRVTHGEP